MKPVRFGLLIQEAASLREWTEKVKRAEAQGFDVLLLPDHFSEQFGPFVALAFAAAATSTMRLGTLVIDNDFRHPALLAKDVATLDVLTEGRVEIGLGAGWRLSDYEQTGIPFEPAGVRVDRLEESVQILRGLMGDGPLTFAGQHYRITGLDGLPKPIQRPAPPILIGGSRKRMLTIAAKYADIVGLHVVLGGVRVKPQLGKTMTADAMDRQIGWLREAAPERFDRLQLQVMVFLVAIDQPLADVAAEAQERFDLPADEALESPHVLAGSVDDVIERIRQRRDRFGISYLAVNERNQETMAKVIARL